MTQGVVRGCRVCALVLGAVTAFAIAPAGPLASPPAPHCYEFANDAEIGDPTLIGACSDNENVTITITQQGTKGTATVANISPSYAVVRYDATEAGSDTIKFKGSDGTDDSPEVTVTTNNRAATNDRPYCISTQPGMRETVEIGQMRSFECFDDENDPITATITQQGTKGNAVAGDVGPASAGSQYTATQLGDDTFKYKASDAGGFGFEAVVNTHNVAAVNDPPHCSFHSSIEANVGETNDYACFDPDGDALTYVITQQPTKGTAAIVDNGTADAHVTYSASAVGTDTVKVTASDGANPASEGTLNFNITAAAGGGGGGNTGGGGTGGGGGNTGGGGTGGGGGNTGAGAGGATGGGAIGGNTGLGGSAGMSEAQIKAPAIGGPSSAGSALVPRSGQFSLPNRSVDCTGSGPSCAVTTTATGTVTASGARASSKKAKAVKLGGSSFTVTSGKKGRVKVKLNKSGLRALKRAKRLRVKVKVGVKRGSQKTTRTFTITLRAPKR